MPAALRGASLAFLAVSALTAQVTRDAPAYSAATIVNAASNDALSLAPYTIIKINGTNLAWDLRALQPSDIRNSMVPPVLPNTGVHVYVRYQAAGILSVSPTQITALIPGDLTPGPAPVWTSLDGISGPVVTVTLNDYAPGVFANDEGMVIASHLGGDLVTADAPLQPGETFVLHCVGLGPADPSLLGLEIPGDDVMLDQKTVVVVYLNDQPIDPSLILDARLVSGQAGIYQLTLQLPPDAPANPELRIEANSFKSPAGFKLMAAGGATIPTGN
jgi:uncharacterized protein (TIGR03437 family)